MVAVSTSDMSISYSETKLRLPTGILHLINHSHLLTRSKLQYKDIFEGISTFPGKPYHINTNPSIPPKRLPCRPVPIHQQDEFKKQLNEMLDAGIIAEVHEATPWINSFVIVETVKDEKRKATNMSGSKAS